MIVLGLDRKGRALVIMMADEPMIAARVRIGGINSVTTAFSAVVLQGAAIDIVQNLGQSLRQFIIRVLVRQTYDITNAFKEYRRQS